MASVNPGGGQGKDGESSPSESSSSSSDEEEGVGHAYEGYQQYQQLDDDCEEEEEKSEEGNEGEGKGPIETTTTTDDKIFSYVDWQKMQTTGEPSEEFKGKDDIFHQSFTKTYTTNFKQDEGEDWFDFQQAGDPVSIILPMSTEKSNKIMEVMGKIKLKPPEWAKKIPEEAWLGRYLN